MNGVAADGEPTHFGSGWLSGTLSAALGLAGLGAVLCFRYPSLLTMPELRALYPVPYVRALLHVVLVSSFLLGAISVTLRRRKTLGAAGMGATLAAALLGGSRVPVQFALILVLTDVTQYWVHRAFHRVPALWRFHAVHHSATTMDWLAGSRLHLLDVAVTRGLTYVPIYVLGFAEGPLFAYVAFVSVQATFIHANVRFDFGPLRWLLATPRFHHWHHAADPAAVDKNFAVHLPVLDRLFGTYHLPDGRWPDAYGIAGGATLPDGYLRQFAQPFRRS